MAHITDNDTPLASHVLDELLLHPWAILPSKLAATSDVVVRHLAGVRLDPEQLAQFQGRMRPAMELLELEGETVPAWFAAGLTERGAAAPPMQGGATGSVVAVIPLRGTILPRAGGLDEMSGVASLATFRANLRDAVNDPNVRAIVLDVDSPGGSVSLVQETGSEIRAARDVKPVAAVANPTTASAAFWLAAQAGRLAVTPSGSIGSVGVVAAHDDVSRALDAMGITKTLLSTAKYKTEGNPYEPLSDEARAEQLRQMQVFHQTFERELSRGRSVPVSQVREQFGEGRMVLASEAVSRGMADEVATLEEVIASMGAKRPRAGRPGSSAMAPDFAPSAEVEVSTPGEPTAAVDAPVIEAAARAVDGSTLGSALAAVMAQHGAAPAANNDEDDAAHAAAEEAGTEGHQDAQEGAE